MEGKYLFGLGAIGCLTALQLVAFALGIDGQVLSFTTAGIGSIIAFLLGINITSPATKTAVKESINAILENKNK